MKKMLLICALLSPLCLSAQQDTALFKNQFSVDVTPFVKQFINLNSSTGPAYTPTYWFSYKRCFHNGAGPGYDNTALRVIVGGQYSSVSTSVSNPWTGTPGTSTHKNYSVVTKLGYELQKSFARRWQAFYGVDAYYSYSQDMSDLDYFNNGLAYGHKDFINSYGGGPVGGVNFYLNKRLMLSTEFGLILTQFQTQQRDFTTPANSLEENTSTVRGSRLAFSSPFSLFLGYNF